MDALPREIEVQRVMNLVRGFGWEKEREEMVGGFIKITISKKIMSEEEVSAAPGPS